MVAKVLVRSSEARNDHDFLILFKHAWTRATKYQLHFFFLIIELHLGESYICIFRYKVISVGTDSYKEETHNHKLVLSQERLCRC